ncbi:hypothetical protein QJS10_CPB20g01144 [Acorus calamus]|uniref:Protein NO VEIN C-terminal domain-containing protein n=1 Tax=Acorus calamus TaxID=4465 RepID=A0AAV9C919_ACOCL|nr:hypothetical protein QJS10_CPB20g01144 [Acorus calamus]
MRGSLHHYQLNNPRRRSGGGGGGEGGGGGRGIPGQPPPHLHPHPFHPNPNLNPSFHNPYPSQRPPFAPIAIQKADAAAIKAHRDLIESGESVSSWKVSESALRSLQVDSWSSLGLQLKDIPSIRNLSVMESKVDMFIQCFVSARRVTSLYDLDLEICDTEGVEKFEDFGLGPILRHPVVQHYFSIPPDMTEMVKVTSFDIVGYLTKFVSKNWTKRINVEDFLDYLARRLSVPDRDKIGIRIQSLGFHVKLIKDAKKGEDAAVKKFVQVLKENPLEMDGEFDTMEEHIESDEDIDANASIVVPQSTSPNSEEEKGHVRLMRNTRKSTGGQVEKCSDQSSCGRLFYEILERPVYMRRIEYLPQRIASTMISTPNNVEKFIKTWKKACQEYSVPEVFDLMLRTYSKKVSKKMKSQKMFTSNPGLGLLHVAVAAIGCGILDGLHNVVQPTSHPQPSSVMLGEAIYSDPSPGEGVESNVEDLIHELGDNEALHLDKSGVTVDDIINKSDEYFEVYHSVPRERELPPEKPVFSRMLHDCVTWLKTEFSAEKFGSLGYGDFFEFLEKYVSLLSQKMHIYLSKNLHPKSYLEASMLQRQLSVILPQILTNSWTNGSVAKEYISMLLRKQFPTVSFQISINDFKDGFLDYNEKDKSSNHLSSILFSTTLLAKQGFGQSPLQHDSLSTQVSSSKVDMGKIAGPLGFLTSEDAFKCLLKAPFLSDLHSWSHWELVFAPSLGPLVEWLLNEVQSTELSCVATSDGKLIRVDHSATEDGFLEASIQGSAYQAATNLLSLIFLYGGTSGVPFSLLKCHAQHAVSVVIKNCIDFPEVPEQCNMHRSLSQGRGFLDDKCLSVEPVSAYVGIGEINEISESLISFRKAISVMSRYILDFLNHLPSEFWSFAADILISGLRSVTKDAPSAIMCECDQINQRVMLHEIGLSLGVIEWIQDYHSFSSTTTTDLFASSGIFRDSSKMSHSASNMVIRGSIDASLTSSPSDNIEANFQLSAAHPEAFDEIKKNIVLTEGCPSNHYKPILSNDQDQDRALIIESIRREEFGLDTELKGSESILLSKQHARLGRALHCLSQELYSQDSHFLLELVQNADDNTYSGNVVPTLAFILQASGVIVLNNEQGFSVKNIRALCDVGNSTKKGSNSGYIGKKGIGFKSVFRIADAPEIHSNGFHVKFDISEGQIGFVLPTVVPPLDINLFERELFNESNENDDASWNTCIVLPFKSKLKEGKGINSIMSMFSDLHPSLLLFLHRLECILFKNMLNDTLVIMRRETLGDGIVRVSHGNELLSWLVVSQKLQANSIRPDVEITEISVAFTLHLSDTGEYEPHLDQQPVFAFLPLRTYGLKFILQGDFVLPSSREEVDGDSAWNQWLLSKFPTLFVNALKSFCGLGCFQEIPGKAVTAYMKFVPLVGEVHGFFHHLPHMIISKLRTSNCLILEGQNGEWVPPCRVLRCWNEEARALLPGSLLDKHLGVGYLNKDIILSDILAKALGVQDYGPKILIDIMSSICNSDDGIQSLGFDWLSAWLNALHATVSFHSATNSLNAGMDFDITNRIRKIRFIPLSDYSYVSLEQGPIWLPCDAFSALEGELGFNAFPVLYSKLRTVNPLLFSASPTNPFCVEKIRFENLLQMLQRMGVKQLSAHEVIRTHILPAMLDDKHVDKNTNLMVEYLSFVMLHIQSACSDCELEKAHIISELQKRCVILTNHGYKCPIDEPVHFSKAFGNPVDMGKLIDSAETEWHEIDAIYLKHASNSQSMSCVVAKWREFCQELGVTDFVQINQVEKNVSDVIPTVFGNISSDLDIGSLKLVVKDWESPELVHLLSMFSSRNDREKCKYLLEVLDKMWDDCFCVRARISCGFESIDGSRFFKSSFMKSICDFCWIASSMDEQLHHATDLFYNCVSVRSILGDFAPYAVPQVNSKKLLEDIGFKIQVTFDDAFKILQSWRASEMTFTASIAQMTKFYTLIWEEATASKRNISEAIISGPFIFVPSTYTLSDEDVVSGMFLFPSEVYWHDPAGCVDQIKVAALQCASTSETNDCPSKKSLALLYPNLHDFFVNECGVPESPHPEGYLQILLLLSRVSLPAEAANAVFRVLMQWAEDLKSGPLKPEKVAHLKESLHEINNTVLPTVQDKWVSLHPTFGLVCWPDDEELWVQFEHSEDVNILQVGEISDAKRKLLSENFALLMQNIGVPSLSEIVSRKAVYYGAQDNTEKVFLVNWVLPYAQRYICKMHPNVYVGLKKVGFRKISELQIIVVEKLYYKQSLKGRGSTSNKRFDCSCLLQESVLYMAQSTDYHSIFLELSRLFFMGSVDLQLSNFLHMITVMAESGSTEEQVESFIINRQKVPKLPEKELAWSLSCLSQNKEHETTLLPFYTSPVYVVQYPSKSVRKPGVSSCWPPPSWRAEQSTTSEAYNPGASSGSKTIDDIDAVPASVKPPVESNDQHEIFTSADILPVTVEVNDEWTIEDDSTKSMTVVVGDHPSSGEQTITDTIDSDTISPNDNPSIFTEQDKLHILSTDEKNLHITGRLGERISYKYFTEKLGEAAVKWVNQEKETGLPYDLIIGEGEECREYVEVKASKCASKDWFPISMPEWQFATEMGESFTIAYVVVVGQRKATITEFKNPLKLCQKNKLQLAVLMPSKHKD